MLQYNSETKTGYILSLKFDRESGIPDDKICLIETIHNISYKKAGNFEQINYKGEVGEVMCKAIPFSFTGICGNFLDLSSKLIAKGFRLEWQGKLNNGNILSVLSGNGITYVLTTDKYTNATVVTESSRSYKYNWVRDPLKK